MKQGTLISPFNISIKKLYSDITDVPELLNIKHIPSLNGLRAVSIFFVMIGHLLSGSSNNILAKIREVASLGVYIFFVISGFLITTLLIKEKIKTGSISLTQFYKRRILRILPLAYLYPIVLFVLNYVFRLHIPLLAFIGPFIFLCNVGYFNRSQYLGHYWSLSVEEQFYLVFPAIFKYNFKFYLNFLFCLLISVIAIRQFDFLSIKSTSPVLYRFSYLKEIIKNLDGIIIGSFLSILTFKKMLPFKFFIKYKWVLNLFLMPLILLVGCHFINMLNESIESVVTSILIAIVLIINIGESNDLIFKFLNNAFIAYVGVMSYSIYIWQQLFTFTVKPPWQGYFKYANSVLLNMIMLAIVSYFSYNFYEKQFLTLKNKA